jgi:hypothetical protein
VIDLGKDLIESAKIDSVTPLQPYEKAEGLNGIKYIITRSDTTGNKKESGRQGR